MTRRKGRRLKPPVTLDCARVLYYAFLEKPVLYARRTLLFVDGKELGRVPRIAICEDSKAGVLLFHCDRHWKVLGASAHESVAAAKKNAESIYLGLSKFWVNPHVTRKKAREYLDKMWGAMRCSFCGKGPDQVKQIFGRGSVHICNDCVKTFQSRVETSR